MPIDETTTDVMWRTKERDVTIDLFCLDGQLYTVDTCKALYPELDRTPQDSQFYRIVADVTYVSGGLAGYTNEIEDMHEKSFNRISVSDLNIPSVTEQRYGLTRIGDYADGDLFLNAFGKRAVWKDGKWIYRYDKVSDGKDGTLVCRRNGVTDEEIEAGIAKGILSCADYFVAPAEG